ncbi:hypothetical protein ACOSP7_027417 [Xanthoceras sorbifolium]
MGLFRRLFGAKKTASTSSSLSAAKEKRRWSFTRSSNTTTNTTTQPSSSRQEKHDAQFDGSLDPNKHAIAVAAATAAVAEAALAAAQAAAEVVRLTSAGGRAAGVSHKRLAEEQVVAAVVKIQSAFRGYLARRALKALKALVKLQALVRGYIVRKQTADMLKRMQTLVKLQAQARASRGHMTESLHSSSKSYLSRITVPESPDKAEYRLRAHSTKFDGPSILKRCGSNTNFRDVVDLDKARLGSNWLDRWMEENIWNNDRVNPLETRHADDEKGDKILEVDTWKPHLNSQQHSRMYRSSQNGSSFDYNYNSLMTIDSPSKLSAKSLNPIPSVSSSGEVLPLSSIKFPVGKGESPLRTADNSPQVHSASYRPGSSSARRGPFTPTKSEYSWGFFGGYSGHPNYMANTESSRAKVRSQSAPRQRLELERYSSTKRSTQGFWDGGNNSERDFPLHSDFRTKAYPATDHLRSAHLR